MASMRKVISFDPETWRSIFARSRLSSRQRPFDFTAHRNALIRYDIVAGTA